MGEALEIAKVLVEPATKLMDMVGSAVGEIYKPFQNKRMADAKAYEIEKIADAISKKSDLPINYQNGDIEIDSTDVNNLIQRTQSRLVFQEAKAQQNIDHVVANAFHELEGEAPVTDEPVDEDWTTRFFNIAKDISSEDMQHIWGKILAGEVSKPGSFSLRTLEKIRNISQFEAKNFSNLVPLICQSGSEYFITSDEKILTKYKVYYSEIMQLDDCGLIASDANIVLNYNMAPGRTLFLRNDDFVILYTSTATQTEKISYGIYSLTEAGRELYNILRHSSNEQYCYDLAENIFNRNRGKLNISVHRVRSISTSSVEYDKYALRVYCEKSGSTQ